MANSYGQNDSINAQNKYQLIDKFPFYQYCKNCGISEDRPMMLCGHNYSILHVGYSYNKSNWIDVGFSKDVASCYPDKGGYVVSTSVITAYNNGLINGLRFSYFRDHLFGLQFYFIKLGINVESYTDYKNIDTRLRPEIRIGDNIDFIRFPRRIQLSYGYNIPLYNHQIFNDQKHQFSIIIPLLIRGWIS